jgi:ribosomal protein S18 acetylase RimI-like enzyme
MEISLNVAVAQRFTRVATADAQVGCALIMEALVRQAVPQDAELIAALHIRSWQTAYHGQLPDCYLDRLGQELEHRVQSWRTQISTQGANKTEIWVVDNGRQVDGFVAIGPARNAHANVTGELYAIYINPNRWGQGLGRTLFTHATGRLASLGYSTAMLWVLESNTRARRFYEIAGWAVDGGTKQESLPDGAELREVSYRIRLRQENEEE